MLFTSASGILVIPEIDSPSHSRAWYSVYPDLMMTTDHNEFNVRDKADQVQPLLSDLFHEIYPLFTSPYVHFGHDEAFGNRRGEMESSLKFVDGVAKY